MSAPLVLAVETSCDETSAAVLRDGSLAGHVIYTQDVHRVYGGVVPEIASRAHLQTLDHVVGRALCEAGATLADVELFAATAGPGLIGALLVGVAWTKAAAWALRRPIVGVHHMEGHLFAAALENAAARPPFVALLVSGGHTLLLWVPEWGTYELLGATRDDAAGEALDKAAKILGLEYPGGPAIQRVAGAGNAARFPLPTPLFRRNQQPVDADFYDFSFSGLKTALRGRVREMEGAGIVREHVADLAAAFQHATVEVLASKTMRAVREMGCRRVLLGGGVANSTALQEALRTRLGAGGELFVPSPRLATDNAAMIAAAAIFRHARGDVAELNLNARADLPFPGLRRVTPTAAGPRSRRSEAQAQAHGQAVAERR